MNKIFSQNLSEHKKWFLALIVTIPLTVILYYIPFSGFGENSNKLTRIERDKDGNITSAEYIQSYKTLWDWLILAGGVAIPIVIFQFQQSDKDNANNLLSEKDRIESSRLHEESLRIYINDISKILLDDKLKILEKEDFLQDIAINVIRARTLSILRRLDTDGIRKGSVILFLNDVGQIKNDSRLRLDNADLRYANLQGAKLSNIRFNYADFSDADLEGAILNDAILYKATLIKANLKGTKLSNAKLSNAKLNGAKFDKHTDFSGTILYNVSFEGMKLPEGINLSNAQLSGANFSNADLRSVNLERANLTGALLPGALLQGANFQNAILTRISLTRAKLDKDTNFSGATFFDVNFEGIEFPEEINFSYAKLDGANLSNTTLLKVDFGSTVLRGANLSNAKLCGAKFANTDLSGVNLDGADLTGATDLTLSQIESAKNWHNAILPPNPILLG